MHTSTQNSVGDEWWGNLLENERCFIEVVEDSADSQQHMMSGPVDEVPSHTSTLAHTSSIACFAAATFTGFLLPTTTTIRVADAMLVLFSRGEKEVQIDCCCV